MTPERKRARKGLERLWRDFDRSTAYGCAQRGQPFDARTCRERWEAYTVAMCAHYGWSAWQGPRP